MIFIEYVSVKSIENKTKIEKLFAMVKTSLPTLSLQNEKFIFLYKFGCDAVVLTLKSLSCHV